MTDDEGSTLRLGGSGNADRPGAAVSRRMKPSSIATTIVKKQGTGFQSAWASPTVRLNRLSLGDRRPPGENGSTLMERCAHGLRFCYPWVLYLMIALIGVVSISPLGAAPSETPSYWDPRRRPEKPDLRGVETLRFLTEDEFPPFNFTGTDSALEGFNVDMARAICAELGVTCTIQARRFDTIVDALTGEEGDAIIAGLAATPAARQKMRFSDPYFRSPARFVAMKAQADAVIAPKALDGKRVAVVSGTAHEAYLAAFFPAAKRVTAKTATLARDLLLKGEADFVFGDGVSLAFWLNGEASKACCQFVGGAYAESHFFGEGLTIAVRADDVTLEKAMNYALFRLWERGVHADLVARWFPVSPYALSR